MGCLPLNLAVCLCVLSCASCPRAAWSCAVVSCLQALQRELPGPVMAVESLRGFLILAVGHRLEMHYKQVTRGYWGCVSSVDHVTFYLYSPDQITLHGCLGQAPAPKGTTG
jgi:hypothetical protein